MGHTLLAYNLASDSAGATNADLSAAVDSDFSQRNNHYIFTEPYQLLADAVVSGATITGGRFQSPTWNAIGEFNLFNISGNALEPPTNPQVDNWIPYSPPLPLMEEFQVQLSNGGAGSLIENAAIVLGTADWNQNLPRGKLPICIKATGTTTWTLNGWSGPVAITLSQSLRGGVYAVCGAQLVADDAVWFRLVFPRYKLYHGRKLRPGWIVENAIRNVANYNLPGWPFTLGEWGRFHTFELPQIDVFGTAADSTAWTLFLWCVYMGEDMSQLSQGLGGGM